MNFPNHKASAKVIGSSSFSCLKLLKNDNIITYNAMMYINFLCVFQCWNGFSCIYSVPCHLLKHLDFGSELVKLILGWQKCKSALANHLHIMSLFISKQI